MVDVQRLRADAAARAVSRPVAPFAGTVSDEIEAGVLARRYVPDCGSAPSMVFLHGGYGLFGDVELQDSVARDIATSFGASVTSVEYPLAPEHTLAESVAAVRQVLEVAEAPSWVFGDSAGGVVALALAQDSPDLVAGLLLTNPHVDLSLRCWGHDASGGPDAELCRWAFRRWAPTSPSFFNVQVPIMSAVGSEDSLLTESRQLVAHARGAGRWAEIIVLHGVGHGFIGQRELRLPVLAQMVEAVRPEGVASSS